MHSDELQIITQLTGVPPQEIQLANDGFMSRGYIIDHGRIVFKFKKSPEVSYYTEVRALNFINTLDLDINIQSVGWTSPRDQYLGLHGVVGNSLENDKNYDRRAVGHQLASALQILHAAHPKSAKAFPLAAEICAWESRYDSAYVTEFLHQHFTEDENHILDNLFYNLTRQLEQLGEKPVFSHGDLGDGNVLVDDHGKVGIIDFSEMYYLDEAADFMDLSDDDLREQMLDFYGADQTLREKVRLRVLLRPFFVLDGYLKRSDTAQVNRIFSQIKTLVN